MACLFFLIPTIFNFISESVQRTYYSSVPIEDLYQHGTLIAHDLCYGELEQLLVSDREVFTSKGIKAEVTRELFRQHTDNVYAKVYEQDEVMVTLEQSEDGLTRRIQRFDTPLSVGQYYWQIRIDALYLPAGVIRSDVSLLRSNNFIVSECTFEAVDEDITNLE